MPVMACQKDGKPGFKYGEGGACFTYTEGDEPSRTKAKRKAQTVAGIVHMKKGGK